MDKMRSILVCLFVLGLLALPSIAIASDEEQATSKGSIGMDDEYTDQKNEGGAMG